MSRYICSIPEEVRTAVEGYSEGWADKVGDTGSSERYIVKREVNVKKMFHVKHFFCLVVLFHKLFIKRDVYAISK